MKLYGLRGDWGPAVPPEGFCLVKLTLDDKTTFKYTEIKHHRSVMMAQYLPGLIPASLAFGHPHHNQLKKKLKKIPQASEYIPKVVELVFYFFIT